LINEPLGHDPNLEPVYLKDIWPSDEEIADVMRQVLSPNDYSKNYGEIFEGNEQWKALEAPLDKVYQWSSQSTYIKEVPFFHGMSAEAPAPPDVSNAKVLLKLGDSITTDHSSPAGSFSESSPAGQYLINRGVEKRSFNSY